MKTGKAPANNVDEYLGEFPPMVRALLQQLRQTIRAAAPRAEELISYRMPAYRLHGMLVYFAGYKNHIGFYAIPSAIKKFEKELSNFKTSKGTVQFPIDKKLPIGLIKRMVIYRVQENEERQAAKKK